MNLISIVNELSLIFYTVTVNNYSRVILISINYYLILLLEYFSLQNNICTVFEPC